VIGYQRPGKAFGTGPDQVPRESLEESPPAGVIAEDFVDGLIIEYPPGVLLIPLTKQYFSFKDEIRLPLLDFCRRRFAMKKSTLACTLFFLFIGVLDAGAADSKAAPSGDSNGYKAVTCSEAQQKSTDRFGRYDGNKDTSMTMSEFDAGIRNNFDSMDTDKNGMVDVKEYVTYWCAAPPKDGKAPAKASKNTKKSMYRQMDANADGKVTYDECVVFWTIRFSDIDKNKDGSMNRDEFGNKAVEWYSEMDVNKDGSVTITEYTNYWVDKCQAKKMKKAVSKQKSQ